MLGLSAANLLRPARGQDGEPNAKAGTTGVSAEPELQSAERRNGRRPPTATAATSLRQDPYRICYCLSGWGIFLTEGFQATIGLPKPPRGHCPREALFYTAGPSLQRRDSLAQLRDRVRGQLPRWVAPGSETPAREVLFARRA
jgi:hypothetical protein